MLVFPQASFPIEAPEAQLQKHIHHFYQSIYLQKINKLKMQVISSANNSSFATAVFSMFQENPWRSDPFNLYLIINIYY